METAVDAASSPQVMAAIWVASGAAAIGLINIVVTIWQGHVTRRTENNRQNREQWWERFTWAAERVGGEEEDFREVGATVLHALANVDWVEVGDKDMIDAILEDLTDEVTDEDVEEALRG